MPTYLLDCNHLGLAIRKVSRVRDLIQQSRRRGNRFVTCHSVLCELEVGIQQMSTLRENRRQLKRLQNVIKVWPLVEQTCRDYGSLAVELKRMGRQLSMTDIILAALARRHKLIILTTDRDFDALPDLKTENWTV